MAWNSPPARAVSIRDASVLGQHLSLNAWRCLHPHWSRYRVRSRVQLSAVDQHRESETDTSDPQDRLCVPTARVQHPALESFLRDHRNIGGLLDSSKICRQDLDKLHTVQSNVDHGLQSLTQLAQSTSARQQRLSAYGDAIHVIRKELQDQEGASPIVQSACFLLAFYEVYRVLPRTSELSGTQVEYR